MSKPIRRLPNYPLELENALGSSAGIDAAIANIVAAKRVETHVNAEKQSVGEHVPTLAEPSRDKGKGVATTLVRGKPSSHDEKREAKDASLPTVVVLDYEDDSAPEMSLVKKKRMMDEVAPDLEASKRKKPKGGEVARVRHDF